jgi:DNA-binding XRE family transcriptional regulator
MTPAEAIAKRKRESKMKAAAKRTIAPQVWRNNLRERRTTLGLSVSDIIEKVGISRYAYVRIENGISDPGLSLAVKIAQFFGQPVDSMWTQYLRDKPTRSSRGLLKPKRKK